MAGNRSQPNIGRDLGQENMDNSLSVTIASDQTAIPVTATIDTTGLATSTIQTNGTQKSQIVDAGGEAATVTGGKLDVNASVDTTGLATSANQTTELGSLSSIDGKIPALGQALAADSVPVILPSATITTLTPPAAITGFATEAGHIAAVDATLGVKTDAKSTATDATSVSAMQVLKQISASVQAPPSQAVTFTGSTDVATETSLNAANGTLDAINTVLNAGVLVWTPANTTCTLSNVASSASNVTLLAANAGRNGAMFFNDSTAILYLKFGATASATSHTVQLVAGAYYELPTSGVIYAGIVDGIWGGVNGSCRVTELT